MENYFRVRVNSLSFSCAKELISILTENFLRFVTLKKITKCLTVASLIMKVGQNFKAAPWYKYKFSIFTKKVQFYFELHFRKNGCWVKHKFRFYTVLAWRQSTAIALFRFDSCRSCVQSFNKLFLSPGENAHFKGEQLRSCVIRQ